MRRDKGFTLIELLIVVAIIGIIAAIAIPSLLNALERARQTTTVANIQKLGQSVEQYIMDHNKVGSPKSGDVTALTDLLRLLQYNTNLSAKQDGWLQDFIYNADPTIGSKKYTITSYGSNNAADGLTGTGIVKYFEDDIIYANGVFIQRPEGAQLSK